MFEVNGMSIDVSGEQLINDLKLSLEQNGIHLFRRIKAGNNNIQFSCPIHKEGQENKPSCGLLLTDVYKGNTKYDAGTVHCFTCGYTATLDEFISNCFGYEDGGIIGNRWLKINYKTELIQKKREFNLSINRRKTITELPTIPEEILDGYRYTHPYMFTRGLTNSLIEDFDIGYDSATNSLTFPVSNEKGEVKWIQTRNVDVKFYKIPEGVVKTDYVYGAYECRKANAKEIYICESPLNALTYWKYGKYAVALFGVGGGNQYEILKRLPARHYICALDNDEAGNKGTARIVEKLRECKLLSKVIYTDSRDINDLQEECLNLKINSINF